MKLTSPLEITPSLMAGVRVGDGWVGVEPAEGHVDHYGKPAWRYQISTEDIEHEGNDLHSWGDAREVTAALLDFLGAAAEAYKAQMGGRESDNADLFPPDVMEWAYQHDDELSILSCELQETECET